MSFNQANAEGADDHHMAHLAHNTSHSQTTQQRYYDCQNWDSMIAQVSTGIQQRLQVKINTLMCHQYVILLVSAFEPDFVGEIGAIEVTHIVLYCIAF